MCDYSGGPGLLEAGHLGENAYLAATEMGLGACGTGAFKDDAMNEILGVDGVDGVEEAVVYMLAVGHRAAAQVRTAITCCRCAARLSPPIQRPATRPGTT